MQYSFLPLHHVTAHMQLELWQIHQRMGAVPDSVRFTCLSWGKAKASCVLLCLQYKTSEVRSKCTGLMRVNLYKDQISTVGSMPPLPNDKALYASLRPAYNVLKAAGQERAHGRPMYAITDDQKKAAGTFLKVSRLFSVALCIALHCIALMMQILAAGCFMCSAQTQKKQEAVFPSASLMNSWHASVIQQR